MNSSTRGGIDTELAFYVGRPHPCSYLVDREAQILFADPDAEIDIDLYSRLNDLGFRRSGKHIYRPVCRGCSQCVSTRLPVEQFKPRRIDRRVLKRNADITAHELKPALYDEHLALYRRYLASRHSSSGMLNGTTAQEYLGFLTAPWCDTRFVEFRAGEQLLGVAVTDYLNQGLSAVYTFYEPEEQQRSLGAYAILWQIEHARRLGLPYLYLGFWIEQSPKMRYKIQYQPLELYRNGVWSEHTPDR